QDFLQNIRPPIGLQRPDFHFTKTLSTELCFTAQWLLRNQAVRTGRTRMDFVLDEVSQLQHIGVTHSNRMVEWFSGSPIEELYLACFWQVCSPQEFFDIFL